MTNKTIREIFKSKKANPNLEKITKIYGREANVQSEEKLKSSLTKMGLNSLRDLILNA